MSPSPGPNPSEFRRAPSVRTAPVWLSLLAAACGGNEGSSAPTAPPGPPELAIVELRPAGGPAWRPGDDRCVPPGRDSRRTVDVVLDSAGAPPGSLPNFTLRPPLACEATLQCGYVFLTVEATDGDAGTRRLVRGAASTSISAPLTELGDPLPERVEFRVELRNDLGQPFVDEQGQSFEDRIEVDLCAPGELPDAGVEGGPADAGMDAADLPDAPRADATPDAFIDGAPRDASADGDAALDAGAPDAADGRPADAASDASADAAPDAPPDVTTEAGLDAATGG